MHMPLRPIILRKKLNEIQEQYKETTLNGSMAKHNFNPIFHCRCRDQPPTHAHDQNLFIHFPLDD